MKAKFYIGILILLTTFFIIGFEQNLVANQQIIIEFSDTNVSVETKEDAISNVKAHLNNIGVSYFKVIPHQDKIIVRYYSNSNLKAVKNTLSQNVVFNFQKASEENKSKHETPEPERYKLNVTEIQKPSNTNWDFEGTHVVQVQQKTDRLYPSKLNMSAIIFGNHVNKIAGNKASFYVTNQSLYNFKAYQFPEVRAGPSTKENV